MAKREKEYRRYTTKNGKKIELRVIKPSDEAIIALGMRSKRTIVSPIAINRPSVEKRFGAEKATLLRKLAGMNPVQRREYLRENAPIDFVKDKSGYKKYKVTCARCGDEVAIVWATDKTLHDWVDMHYMQKHDEKTWYGCLVPSISQIDEELGFECCCGEDTRDFRGRTSLAPVLRGLAIEYSMKHREFNKPTSAFIAMEAK